MCVCKGWGGLSRAYVPLSGISHGNSSRIPPRAGDGSVAAPWRGGGGWGSAAGPSDGFSAQLLFQQHSLSAYADMSVLLCTFVV